MPIHFPEQPDRNDPVGVLLPRYVDDTQLIDDRVARRGEHSMNQILVYGYCAAFVLFLIIAMVMTW